MFTGLDIIYKTLETRETVFHRDIQTPTRDWVENTTRKGLSISDEIRGVSIANETLSRVFDKSFQSKHKLKSKRRSKIVKIYFN